MPRTRFDIAKKKIVEHFSAATCRVHSYTELCELLSEQRPEWNLPYGMTAKRFIAELLEKTQLRRMDLEFPSIKITRYLWEEATPFEVAVSLRPHSYLTHYSAAYLHGLTDQVPKRVYVNAEQPRKPKKGKLSQSSINGAFRRPPRETTTLAPMGDVEIALLNGQHTGRLGVQELKLDEHYSLQVSTVERTLIDMAVRPTYSGGVFEVLNAYRRAGEGDVSVNRLVAMLKKLEFVYPYHQAIGFLLDSAGNYSEAQLSLLDSIEQKFDFYLAHQMADTEYSERWQLYYPRGLI